MYINRNISRVLAAAVASTGFAVVPMPTFAAQLVCTAASFNAAPDGAGNITVSCTEKSAPGGDTTTPPPPPPPTDGGTTTPPTPTGPISCAGYSNTIVVDIPWGPLKSGNVRVTTRGFGNGGIVVARFTTPSTTATSIGKIQSAEYGGGPIHRTAALSTTPCDFPSPPLAKFYASVPDSTSPTAQYLVGGSSIYYATLRPSTTYYFNIKNEVNGVPTCSQGTCDMFVELQKPSGL